jgi:signal transduction histidine kinase
MRFERLKAILRSLRFRLSAWNTAAVLVIVIVTLLGLREAMRFMLTSEDDRLLLDDTNEVVLAVEQFYPDLDEIESEMNRKALGHVDRGLFVQLVDGAGQVTSTKGRPPLLEGIAPPPPGKPSLATIGGYRIASRLISKRGLPPYTVRVGTSLARIDSDLARLSWLMTAAGIIILFVAPASGYFLAGRATRPLALIISTAARLRPSRMDERLPIRGTKDELDKLSTTINHFLDLLRDYLERHREFVDNAAHELRSPLAAVQSSVEVTLNAPRTVREYEDVLGAIADECGQLGVLVNQLLLLTETDSTQLPERRQSVRFDNLVARSIDMFRGAAEERGIQLDSNVGRAPVIDGDAKRLRQVVNNLVDNGLKFTPRGGRVLVTLDTDNELGQLVLRVTDTGIGISPQDLPHVFERFYRGDKSRQRENAAAGSGLGLSICKSIVAAHGGTIEAASTVGKGATFVVRLPISRDPINALCDAPAGLSGSEKP